MNYLNKQIHFTASAKRQLLIGLILCLYLCFIVIVLQPFDTSSFDARYKKLLLSGYGIFAGIVFVIYSRVENRLYFRRNRFWTVKQEVIAALLYCFLTGSILYMYNRTIVNNFKPYTLFTYFRFLGVTVPCMIPVFIPIMIYLRQKFGERIIPPAENSFKLIGENKNEILEMEKDRLLFIKAVENYVEVCFVDSSEKTSSVTFRRTLSNVSEQLPFLEQCHRSYLVNTSAIKEIIGNSQGAKITFAAGEKEIPLSKTYYKQVKATLS